MPDTRTDALAADLTRHAVLANDPAVRVVAADFWLHSGPYYRGVDAALAELVAADGPAREAHAALREHPTDRAREVALHAALAALLAGPGAPPTDRLRELVAEADREVDIDYHPAVADPVAADPVDVARLRAAVPAGPPAPPESPRLLVVVPFRDRVGGARLRNLLACLAALRDQTLARTEYAVTVVEADAAPTHRDAIGALADHHLFVPQPGDFNKSWAVNAAVRHTAPRAPALCLLDADILADRSFLERNLDRLDAVPAHVGHDDMLCLDDASSDAAIERRVLRGEPDAAVDSSRGLLLHRVVGAAVWLRRAVFEQVGGMDERYVGWGGEDDDFAGRVRLAAGLAGFDDLLVHLAHPRPEMERAGRPLNGHLTPLSWPAGARFGSLTAPSDLTAPADPAVP